MTGKVIPLPVAAHKQAPKKKKGGKGPPPMRLFVALNPPETWRAAGHDLVAPHAESLEFRPVPVENVHLTLSFLGSVPWARSNAISKGLRGAAAGVEPFEVAPSAPGAFPSLLKPRVLWLGVEEHASLMALQDAVSTVLEALGFRRETRAFRPHLTLARLRRLPEPGPLSALRRDIEAFEPPTEPWRVHELHLVRSFLESDGARYQALATIPLGRDDRAP